MCGGIESWATQTQKMQDWAALRNTQKTGQLGRGFVYEADP